MQDNEFVAMLDEKIASLQTEKNKMTARLMNGQWHGMMVEQSITRAIDELEEASAASSSVDVGEELYGILQQMPGLVKSIWRSQIEAVDGLDKEIARWKEMSQYYTDFMEKKKKEEEGKKKEGEGKKEEEIRREKLMAGIASGELKEPSKMTAIRRKIGDHPGPTIKEYRNLGAALKESKTSDVDDSRG